MERDDALWFGVGPRQADELAAQSAAASLTLRILADRAFARRYPARPARLRCRERPVRYRRRLLPALFARIDFILRRRRRAASGSLSWVQAFFCRFPWPFHSPRGVFRSRSG